MKLAGTYPIDAPRQIVWDLLNDPDALARALPGCERLTRLGDNRDNVYEGVISIGIASIRSSYTGTVTLSDIRPPESYAIAVQGQGKGGFVRGTGRIGLSEEGGATTMTVSGDAQVGGPIAMVGQRLLDGAAKKVLKEFAAALAKEARAKIGV